MRLDELRKLIAVYGPDKTLGALAAEFEAQHAAEMATRHRRVEARIAAMAAEGECAHRCGPHPGCCGACEGAT